MLTLPPFPIPLVLLAIQYCVAPLHGSTRTGAQPPPGATTDVRPVLEGITEDFQSGASSAGLSIAVDAPVETAVACSSGALITMLSNLVSNAIKHGRRGGEVKIRIHDGSLVRFEVQDDGEGISPQDQQRLFRLYSRGRNEAAPGLGLGLATMKRLVDSYG